MAAIDGDDRLSDSSDDVQFLKKVRGPDPQSVRYDDDDASYVSSNASTANYETVEDELGEDELGEDGLGEDEVGEDELEEVELGEDELGEVELGEVELGEDELGEGVAKAGAGVLINTKISLPASMFLPPHTANQVIQKDGDKTDDEEVPLVPACVKISEKIRPDEERSDEPKPVKVKKYIKCKKPKSPLKLREKLSRKCKEPKPKPEEDEESSDESDRESGSNSDYIRRNTVHGCFFPHLNNPVLNNPNLSLQERFTLMNPNPARRTLDPMWFLHMGRYTPDN